MKSCFEKDTVLLELRGYDICVNNSDLNAGRESVRVVVSEFSLKDEPRETPYGACIGSIIFELQNYEMSYNYMRSLNMEISTIDPETTFSKCSFDDNTCIIYVRRGLYINNGVLTLLDLDNTEFLSVLNNQKYEKAKSVISVFKSIFMNKVDWNDVLNLFHDRLLEIKSSTRFIDKSYKNWSNCNRMIKFVRGKGTFLHAVALDTTHSSALSNIGFLESLDYDNHILILRLLSDLKKQVVFMASDEDYNTFKSSFGAIKHRDLFAIYECVFEGYRWENFS